MVLIPLRMPDCCHAAGGMLSTLPGTDADVVIFKPGGAATPSNPDVTTGNPDVAEYSIISKTVTGIVPQPVQPAGVASDPRAVWDW